MKKKLFKLFGVIAVLIAIVIGNFVGKTTVDAYSSTEKKAKLNSILVNIASGINTNLPMMIDTETQLTSTMGLSNEFRYNYTLINFSIKDISPKEISNQVETKIINGVCTTKEMKFFVERGVTVSYAYHSKDGKQITIVSVPSSKCKNI